MHRACLIQWKEGRMVSLLTGTMAAHSTPMAGGDRGVAQTISAMRRLIEQGRKDPSIRELAAQILHNSHVPAFDFAGEARAVYEWVRQNIRFTRDVYGVETLHAAREIVRLGIGDCDDFTVLICSLLGNIGHRTRIVTISKPEDEKNFSHVFPQTCVNGNWITLDAARVHAAFGREPENVDRVRVWSVTSDDHRDVRGLLNGPSGNSPAVNIISPRGVAGRPPNALPGAYSPWVADPRYRNLRGHSLRGLGKYGRHEVIKALRSMNGLGDDGIDWSSVADIVKVGTTGAANIIAATRATPYNLYPTTAVGQTSTPLQNPLLAQQQLLQSGTIAGIPTGTLLLGALGLGALALFAGRR